jgi:hypothetical protein
VASRGSIQPLLPFPGKEVEGDHKKFFSLLLFFGLTLIKLLDIIGNIVLSRKDAKTQSLFELFTFFAALREVLNKPDDVFLIIFTIDLSDIKVNAKDC